MTAMGLFGKSKKETPATIATGGTATQVYHDINNDDLDALPVATLVADSDLEAIQHQQQHRPPPSAPPAPTTVAAQPPPARQQQQQQQQQQQSFAVLDPTLIRSPMMMRQCPNCHIESRTRIETFPTWQSWLLAFGLIFIFWPLCWLPLVLDSCKQTNHYCVSCNAHVGTITALSDCCVTRRG